MTKPKLTERSIEDYQPDPKNANRGTARGEKMLVDSFKESGAGRSIFVAEDDVVVSGNQSIKAARKAGIKRVVEVTVPRDALVAVKREGLKHDSPEARRLAIADNRTQQVDLSFDPEVLLDDPGLLDGLFLDHELELLQAELDAEQIVTEALDDAGDTGRDRITANRPKQIKVVLYAPDVATFEQALAAVDIPNRGEALLEICRYYLEHRHEG